MGKKSRRKTVKAKAASAATSSAGLRLGPNPGGIINTNIDPHRCASCLSELTVENGFLNPCCGTEMCEACPSLMPQCRHCGKRLMDGPVQFSAILKQRAEEGYPWAQMYLGLLHHDGDIVSRLPGIRHSQDDAFLWLTKAAAQNQPHAMIKLSSYYYLGKICQRDSSRAHDLMEQAVKLYPMLLEHACDELGDIALEISGDDPTRFVEAASVLEPWLYTENRRLKGVLSVLFISAGTSKEAVQWCGLASFGPPSSYRSYLGIHALAMYSKMGKYSQAKFFLTMHKRIIYQSTLLSGEHPADNKDSLAVGVRWAMDKIKGFRTFYDWWGCTKEFYSRYCNMC